MPQAAQTARLFPISTGSERGSRETWYVFQEWRPRLPSCTPTAWKVNAAAKRPRPSGPRRRVTRMLLTKPRATTNTCVA